MKKDLRETCINLILDNSEIKNIICLMSNGEEFSGIVEGINADISCLLLQAMLDRPYLYPIFKNAVETYIEIKLENNNKLN